MNRDSEVVGSQGSQGVTAYQSKKLLAAHCLLIRKVKVGQPISGGGIAARQQRNQIVPIIHERSERVTLRRRQV